MASGYSFVDADFLDKSTKVKDLGEGTFGSVALYETPKGRYVIKQTKLSNKSPGYPPDLLAEIDMLMKLRPLENVIRLEGACFDSKEKKGFMLLEYLDTDLGRWIKHNDFNRRMKYLPRLISQIGGVLELMHRFGFIHNDIKSNNILVKETSNGPIFKLADFGKAAQVSDERKPYGGIERYRPPAHSNIYYSESWAFMICLTEVVIGHKLARHMSIKDFYNIYMVKNNLDLKRYIKRQLEGDDCDDIPRSFWKVVYPIIDDYHLQQDRRRHGKYRKFDLNGLSGLSSRSFRLVSEGLSRPERTHPGFIEIKDEFYKYFVQIKSEQLFESFAYLMNKFLWNGPSLNPASIKCYAEVAMIILIKNKTRPTSFKKTSLSFVPPHNPLLSPSMYGFGSHRTTSRTGGLDEDEWIYFDSLNMFLEFERAFLAVLGFQVIITPRE